MKENYNIDNPFAKDSKVIKTSKDSISNRHYKKRGKNLSGTIHKNKPFYDDKIDHRLDGSKDFSQFRDHGKFGSYPEYDDFGEESEEEMLTKTRRRKEENNAQSLESRDAVFSIKPYFTDTSLKTCL